MVDCKTFRYEPKTFELICPNDGPSYFDTEHDNSFFVKCHLCEWEAPNPDYKAVISDEEMLGIIADRWKKIHAGEQVDTPDQIFAPKYSQDAIYSKMEELDHRGLLDWGVSLRTAWLSEKGQQCLENLQSLK